MNTKNLKKIAHWVLPIRFQELLKKKFASLRTPRSIKKNINKNNIFRNIHKGQRCFILATGPSIANQNLEMLNKEICFSVGEFNLHPLYNSIKPKYNIVPPNHEPFGRETLKITNHRIKESSDDTINFFGYTNYKWSHYRFFKCEPSLNPKNCHYLNYDGSSYLNEFNYKNKKLWDITTTLFACRTVVYSALQVAIFMGFSKIYLLGCDHDYLIRKLQGETFRDHHFYKDEQDRSAESVPAYLENFSLENWFHEYYYRWKEYRLILEYAKSLDINIFNATKGGMLDVFPRIEFDKLFNKY